jgi:hypothetical protein
MKKYLLVIIISYLLLACSFKNKEHTFDEFEYAFSLDLEPMGTFFWDEFINFESQYGLVADESKLLGRWCNITPAPSYISFIFFPNKLFLLQLAYKNFLVSGNEKKFYGNLVGTWEIDNGVVCIMIFAVIIVDTMREYLNNKEIFVVDQTYSVKLIKIDDIDERGFTKRPISDSILSKELERKVTVIEPNKSNNLYVRNVYTMDVVPEFKKNYGYFSIVPDMAHENLSGLDVATSPVLIEKYIFSLWP